MAFVSNMEPSSVKKIRYTLDPSPELYPTELSDGTCIPVIALPSCSYAQSVLENKFPLFKPSAPKLWSIESLNRKLEALCDQKLVHLIREGRTTDTINFHRHALLKELKQSFQLPEDVLQDFSYRNQLITLLASTSKFPIKDIPQDESEWSKLLNHWVKKNSINKIIFNLDIYKILAVDGFYGFEPDDLKNYLKGILSPLRNEFEMHARGVRAMYDFIRGNSLIASLPGTNSACLVFLALLKYYVRILQFLLLDKITHFQMEYVMREAEGFLQKHSDYYRDIQNVDNTLLNFLAKVYINQFLEPEQCKIVGAEMLKLLSKKFKVET